MSKVITRWAMGALFGLWGAQVAAADFILSAPPRESPAEGQAIYGPLAEYLSKITGENIIYQYPSNWGVYQAKMTTDKYDLVFDGPHFVSWRIQRLKHLPVAALPGSLRFVVVARQDHDQIRSLENLNGKGVCAHSPPNLATLTLFEQFTNPGRQPRVVQMEGFDKAYESLLSSKCVAAVLPMSAYQKLEGQSKRTKVLFESKAYANQALTVGIRVPGNVREKIARALVSTENKQATSAIAASLGGSEFIAVTQKDYDGYDGLLKNVWGFEAR